MHHKNKYKNGILPMTLINFAIGSVYCWTLFKEDVLRSTTMGPSTLAWAFSLALFILGMAAAFGGRLVERSPKRSAWLTFVFFTSGWVLTGIAIQLDLAWLLIAGFGIVQGVGLGLGYITPVKTMMLWIGNRKGFAAALSITAFGLAGVIANPIIQALLDSGLTSYQVFYLLAAVYGVCLIVGALLLYRPEDAEQDAVGISGESVDVVALMTSPKFALLWVVLFLNITGGLALISHEKQIYEGQLGVDFFLTLVMITATANLLGRILLGAAQDKMKHKHTPYYLMIVASIVAVLVAFVTARSGAAVWTSFALVFVVQFMFGVGFACNPEILRQNWGMKHLSTIQGLMLTAWAFAGLLGNQISNFVIGGVEGDQARLQVLYGVLLGLYSIQLVAMLIWARIAKRTHSRDVTPEEDKEIEEKPAPLLPLELEVL